MRWVWLLVLWLHLPVLAESFDPQTHLKRIAVGIQAGLVRVVSDDGLTVLYTRGLDDPSSARYTEESRQATFAALNIDPASIEKLAFYMVKLYPKLTRHAEATALLGAILSSPTLSKWGRSQLEFFLVTVMNSDKQVEAKRQALLALAVAPTLSDFTMDRVVGKFERIDNLWELFPMQQFFEYQGASLKSRKIYPKLRERLERVDSIYTPGILEALDKAR
ncbi:MAG: hypothetical protein J0I12_20505 [Candidatus Eremiobacteraeota bacterium]|nr:hypothetical protein [Candidatus Eremiobacteraeota bacterium]